MQHTRHHFRERTLVTALLVMTMMIGLIDGYRQPEEALAASKITLKSGKAAPSTIYAGHSYNLKVAGAKVKFATSNKRVATIGANTGKMKAVAPGNVKITAKNAKSGKIVASKTFTILQRSKSVSCCKKIYLAPGDTYILSASTSPNTSTDVIRFTSSDKTIATVGATSGKIIAKKKGITTINVYAKATKATANSNKNNKTTTCKVIVCDKEARFGFHYFQGYESRTYSVEDVRNRRTKSARVCTAPIDPDTRVIFFKFDNKEALEEGKITAQWYETETGSITASDTPVDPKYVETDGVHSDFYPLADRSDKESEEALERVIAEKAGTHYYYCKLTYRQTVEDGEEPFFTESSLFTQVFTVTLDATMNVTFDANGGAYSDGATTKEAKFILKNTFGMSTYFSGVKREAAADDPYIYEFKGWATTPDAETPNVNSTDEVKRNTKLYAVWEQKIKPTPTPTPTPTPDPDPYIPPAPQNPDPYIPPAPTQETSTQDSGSSTDPSPSPSTDPSPSPSAS